MCDSTDGDEWMHVKVPVKNGILQLNKAVYKYNDEPYYLWEIRQKRET